jgi:hypothetical protein
MTDRRVEYPDWLAEIFEIKDHDGWTGAFTEQTFPGALLNGTRVIKVAQDPSGDRTPPGQTGKVLGSIGHPQLGILYFVEWDGAPKVAVAVHQRKIRAV